MLPLHMPPNTHIPPAKNIWEHTSVHMLHGSGSKCTSDSSQVWIPARILSSLLILLAFPYVYPQVLLLVIPLVCAPVSACLKYHWCSTSVVMLLLSVLHSWCPVEWITMAYVHYKRFAEECQSVLYHLSHSLRQCTPARLSRKERCGKDCPEVQI